MRERQESTNDEALRHLDQYSKLRWPTTNPRPYSIQSAMRTVLEDFSKLGRLKNDPRLYEVIVWPRDKVVTHLGFEFDPARRKVKRPDGQTISLSWTEAKLFTVLLANPGEPVERKVIFETVWGEGPLGESPVNNLRTFIHSLRAKLGDTRSDKSGQYRYINSISRQGYVFSKE